MNTIGKVLVIFVFLFAIVVCFLSVLDFATRAQWREKADDLKRQVEVMAHGRATDKLTYESTLAANKALQGELETAKQKLADAERAATIKVDELNLLIA